MIILVGGEKGGAGKSCLSQNLAVYLQTKNRDVLLLDADPQGTTTDWIKERDDNDDLKIFLQFKLLAISAQFSKICKVDIRIL
jgi:cellulose biosynthesis protein BcsQ